MINDVDSAMALIAKHLFEPLISRQNFASNQNLDFAHYTNAETAFKIIESESFQMRNSRMMNDYSEISLGLDAVRSLFYKTHKGASIFWEKMRHHDNRFETIVDEHFAARSQLTLSKSYIGSLSEYDFNRRSNGKLSMWRSYGFPNGVALIFEREEILSEAGHLDIYSYPVIYTEQGLHVPELIQCVESLAENTEELYDYSGESIAEALVNILLHLAVCIKDSNFTEEQEWRVVYTEKVSDATTTDSPIKVVPVVLGGVAQNVCRVSLDQRAPIQLKKILKAVVIGPTQHPHVTFDAFVRLLSKKDYKDPELMVFRTNIPFRG